MGTIRFLGISRRTVGRAVLAIAIAVINDASRLMPEESFST
jgi:hypothetical protein